MTQDTSAQELIARVADRAFHEHGTERVSVRDILREAEQGNMSAVNYHFGGRDGLLRAVFRRRRERLNVDRTAYLDKAEAEGRGGDVRALVEASVYPHAKLVRESPRESDFARFAARMAPRVDYSSRAVDELQSADQRVIRGLQQALSNLPEDVVDNRIDTAFTMILGVLSAYEVRREEGLTHGPEDFDTLAETLIDMVTAGLTA